MDAAAVLRRRRGKAVELIVKLVVALGLVLLAGGGIFIAWTIVADFTEDLGDILPLIGCIVIGTLLVLAAALL